MFYASQEIQTWFTECANTICGPLLKPVEWTTPLGLSIVQPYMKRGTYEDKKDKIQNVNAGIDVKKLLKELATVSGSDVTVSPIEIDIGDAVLFD